MNSIKYPLVMIKWVDSYGAGSSWGSTKKLHPSAHYCYSVGWVVKRNKEVAVIVPHLSPKNVKIGAYEAGCGDMTIPSSAIVDWVELVPEEK